MSIEKVCYHTQECRGTEKLTHPIKCQRDDAWFGEASYFWDGLDDANFWGKVSKRATGKYDVYSSKIIIDDFLDTVSDKYNALKEDGEELLRRGKKEGENFVEKGKEDVKESMKRA